MQFVGFLLAVGGIIALIWGAMQKAKAGRVADAPFVKTGDALGKGASVAGPKGAIAVQGSVRCDQPVIAPMSGTPCLYYELKAFAVWKEGNANKSKELHKEKVAARFTIDDGSGAIAVDASEGGDFEPTQRKDHTQGTGIIGGITGTELSFGQFKLQTGMLTLGSGTKYRVEESALPMQSQLYVCGKLADGGGVITAPGWRALIMSHQSRDALLASATKTAKLGLFGGGGATAVGIILVVVGQLLGGGAAAAKTEPEGAASASAAALASAAPAYSSAAAAPSGPAASAPAATSAAVAAKPAAAGGGAYKLHDKVNVEWKGSNCPAEIIAVQAGDKYKIHYDGYADSWDEVVGPSRIKGKR